jgi:hypothetical protein
MPTRNQSEDKSSLGGLKLALAVLILSLFTAPIAWAEPYLDKVEATPDYTQTDQAYGGLPGGGTQYCGPVTVSNSLIWLADNGFPQLAQASGDRKADQFDLIKILGDEDHMDTSLNNGTGVFGVTSGVQQYITERGLAYERLEYQGWRTRPASVETGQDWPQLDWIQTGIQGLGAVWLNIGWYTYDPLTDAYYRVGGHWVTLVGHGHDGENENPAYLIVHDPAPRDGLEFNNCHVRVELIQSGWLTGTKTGLPREAAGYYKLGGELKLNTRADCGILDGVVVLEMPAP